MALHGNELVDSPGPYTDDEVAAAIQIAIWDIEYGAAFTYDALGSPVDAAPPDPSGLVAQYISNVQGGPWVEDFDYAVLSEADNQTVIWAPEIGREIPGGFPEPSTWAMMLLGFASLGFAGYRRAKAKASFANA